MKLDLSALTEKQREEVRRIVDGNDVAMKAAMLMLSTPSPLATEIRTAIRLNARICAAISRAEQAKKKGAP